MSSPESRESATSSGERARLRPKRGGPSPDRPEADEPRGPDSSGPPNPSMPEPAFGWTYRGFLIPYILLALSVQRAHGYFIDHYLRGLGLANVELSTLYRTLRQLERDGLVRSTWEPGPDGPARRIYSLTDAGRWWLDAGAAALAGYRSLIDRFFGSYAGPTPGPDGDNHEKGASR